MDHNSGILTLADFLSLPIAKQSTFRIVTRTDSGGIKSLWMGCLVDLHWEIHNNENFNSYTEVKLITMGNGNRNAIITV